MGLAGEDTAGFTVSRSLPGAMPVPADRPLSQPVTVDVLATTPSKTSGILPLRMLQRAGEVFAVTLLPCFPPTRMRHAHAACHLSLACRTSNPHVAHLPAFRTSNSQGGHVHASLHVNSQVPHATPMSPVSRNSDLCAHKSHATRKADTRSGPKQCFLHAQLPNSRNDLTTCEFANRENMVA
jgi:hypothetical protein